MGKLGIFLNFNGNCAEVLQFYAKVFETTTGMIMRYGDAPSDSQVPGIEDKIMHSEIIVGGERLMLADMPSQNAHVVGNNFALSYHSNDFDKLRRIFEALSEGGIVIMPMGKTFFSELYGMVTDKFGITWNVIA